MSDIVTNAVRFLKGERDRIQTAIDLFSNPSTARREYHANPAATVLVSKWEEVSPPGKRHQRSAASRRKQSLAMKRVWVQKKAAKAKKK